MKSNACTQKTNDCSELMGTSLNKAERRVIKALRRLAVSAILLLAAAAATSSRYSPLAAGPADRRFKIRTITAGINLKNVRDSSSIQSAVAFLERAKTKFESAGYQVQTIRI